MSFEHSENQLRFDLKTYVNSNKQIVCPREQIQGYNAEILKDAKAHAAYNPVDKNWYYIDSEGNIARFQLDISQIDSLQDVAVDQLEQETYRALEKIGFKPYGIPSGTLDCMLGAIGKYQLILKGEEAKNLNDNFNL
jgi:hypothetical protein